MSNKPLFAHAFGPGSKTSNGSRHCYACKKTWHERNGVWEKEPGCIMNQEPTEAQIKEALHEADIAVFHPQIQPDANEMKILAFAYYREKASREKYEAELAKATEDKIRLIEEAEALASKYQEAKFEAEKWKERAENVAKIGGQVAQSAAGHADAERAANE